MSDENAATEVWPSESASLADVDVERALRRQCADDFKAYQDSVEALLAHKDLFHEGEFSRWMKDYTALTIEKEELRKTLTRERDDALAKLEGKLYLIKDKDQRIGELCQEVEGGHQRFAEAMKTVEQQRAYIDTCNKALVDARREAETRIVNLTTELTDCIAAIADRDCQIDGLQRLAGANADDAVAQRVRVGELGNRREDC